MVAEQTGHELIEACRRGEPDSFRALFDAYRDRVYSVALRYAGDHAAAMDIAQDTFVKLFDSIADFRGEGSFESWIYRVVANRCLDHRRRSRRLFPLTEGLAAMLRAPDNHLAGLLKEEMRGQVRTAIDRLPPELRITVVLRYTEGLAYDQIAEALSCSPGTVASRLHRAHKLLEHRLSGIAKEGGHYV